MAMVMMMMVVMMTFRHKNSPLFIKLRALPLLFYEIIAPLRQGLNIMFILKKPFW
jgi:hypothetical protein